MMRLNPKVPSMPGRGHPPAARPGRSLQRDSRQQPAQPRGGNRPAFAPKSVENPFQCYLAAIGRVPLLTRNEERRLTHRLGRLRNLFRRMLLNHPIVLRAAVGILREIRAGKRRIDRTLEFGVSDSAKRRKFEAVLSTNLPTLEHLLDQQALDERRVRDAAASGCRSPDIRRRMRRRQRKAVQLVEELQLRMSCFQELDDHLLRHVRSANAAKHFGLTNAEVGEIGRQKSLSLREGRALRPGEGGFCDLHRKPLVARAALRARSSRLSQGEGSENAPKGCGSAPVSAAGSRGAVGGPGHAPHRSADGAAPAHSLVPGDRYLRRLARLRRSYEAVVDALVSANLRLVVSIAKRYPHTELELADLVQEGNIGLLRAIDKFDGSRGCKFATYATWWVRQAILCALTDKGRAIRIPASARDRLARLARFQDEWRSEHGRSPTVEEAEVAGNVSRDESKRFGPLLQPTVSLDQTMTYHGDESLCDFLADDRDEPPLKQLERETHVRQAAAVQRDLTSKERLVIGLRFGLIDGRDRSLAEVGRELSVSRERARQIEAVAMQKMRARGADVCPDWTQS